MRISDWSSDVCSSDLFTQGMVTHETYRATDGRWLSPDEIDERDGKLVETASGKPVEAGRVEQMSKSKKNTTIGRASCRESVCTYVSISMGAVSLKKKHTSMSHPR